jgi:hypothetical protein
MNQAPHASKHAEKRAKERISLPKSALQSDMERAWECGLKQGEVTGRIQKFMAGVYFRHKKSTNTRIYNDLVYCFAPDKTLITVIPLPTNLRTACRRALKGKKKSSREGAIQ